MVKGKGDECFLKSKKNQNEKAEKEVNNSSSVESDRQKTNTFKKGNTFK